jgi:hypothetical protein
MQLCPSLAAIVRPRRLVASQRHLFYDPQPHESADGGSTAVQTSYRPGACVYDMSHHKSRGYGVILKPAEPAEDGAQRWLVKWEKEGARSKPIKESSLGLALIPNSQRSEITAIGQRFTVVVGTFKCSEGVTVKKASGYVDRCRENGGGAKPFNVSSLCFACYSSAPLACASDWPELDLPAGWQGGTAVIPP